MADKTKIEWTDATWNPITGCTLVSEGCRHCYAATLAATRLRNHPSRKGLARINAAGEAKFTGEVRFNEEWLDQPLHWRKPRMIFVCAHGDLFHPRVPVEWIDKVFAVAAMTPQHTYQILTKRPGRMLEYLANAAGRIANTIIAMRRARGDMGSIVPLPHITPGRPWWPLPNVWAGVSVEDQATADERIPFLLDTLAARRWVSYEPALGGVDWKMITRVVKPGYKHVWNALTGNSTSWWPNGHHNGEWAYDNDAVPPACPRLDWIVMGGESGPGARPMHPDWARKTRDDCDAAGVPFLFKQWGAWCNDGPVDAPDCVVALDGRSMPFTSEAMARENLIGELHYPTRMYRVTKKKAGRTLDGRTHDAWPEHAS